MVSPVRVKTVLIRMFWVAVAALTLLGLWGLETERATVQTRTVETGQGLVTLYDTPSAEGPLVLVAHGFAGSRQMMQYLSRDMARAGYRVAAFDFFGHGRNGTLMSPDVTRIEGTTQQLVAQTRHVRDALEEEVDLSRGVALLGHSMATDIVIRAAQEMPDVQAIIAISMYSDAVTGHYPQRLLILSGEWETRLREVARRAVAQVGGAPVEGITVNDDVVARRAAAVDRTEHVSVLFSAASMQEIRAWLAAAFGRPVGGAAVSLGPVVLGVLTGLALLIWPVSRVLPQRAVEMPALTNRQFFLALFAPGLPAVAACYFGAGSLLGIASFRGLFAFFAVWGGFGLVILALLGRRPRHLRPEGLTLTLVWGLGIFAMALDRYGAAFLPGGPRLALMALFCAATIPFMLTDRLLVAQAAVWQRVLARLVPVAALSFSMVFVDTDLALLFTVMPVMVLFYLVFGTMERAIAQRSGAGTAGLALGVILAWSIASSTPLFAG